MVLDVCSRSKYFIEPLIKPQWYMDCDVLAQRALDAVFKDKTLTLLPQKEAEQQWTYFLGSIRKWCISRQLWWGHRVPAWRIVFEDGALPPADWDTKDPKLNWVVARSEQEAQAMAAQVMAAQAMTAQTQVMAAQTMAAMTMIMMMILTMTMSPV